MAPDQIELIETILRNHHQKIMDICEESSDELSVKAEDRFLSRMARNVKQMLSNMLSDQIGYLVHAQKHALSETSPTILQAESAIHTILHMAEQLHYWSVLTEDEVAEVNKDYQKMLKEEKEEQP